MSKLSSGGIAGIVVGCVTVLLAIILCFYRLCWKRRKSLSVGKVPARNEASYEGRFDRFELDGPPVILPAEFSSRYSYGRRTSSEQKVREVRPDPVCGEVWMPRLFEKARVRLKIIQDDVELD